MTDNRSRLWPQCMDHLPSQDGRPVPAHSPGNPGDGFVLTQTAIAKRWILGMVQRCTVCAHSFRKDDAWGVFYCDDENHPLAQQSPAGKAVADVSVQVNHMFAAEEGLGHRQCFEASSSICPFLKNSTYAYQIEKNGATTDDTTRSNIPSPVKILLGSAQSPVFDQGRSLLRPTSNGRMQAARLPRTWNGDEPEVDLGDPVAKILASYDSNALEYYVGHQIFRAPLPDRNDPCSCIEGQENGKKHKNCHLGLKLPNELQKEITQAKWWV